MKINERVSLLVMLEKSKVTADGKAPVFIRLTIDGKRGELSLGQKVHLKNWDQQKGYVRGASTEARLTNNTIDVAVLKIKKLYEHLCRNEEYVSAEMVKSAYQGKQEKEKTLMEVIDFVIDRVRQRVAANKRAPATLTKWNTAKDKVISFLQAEYNANDISLRKVKMSFAEDFVDYLMLKEGIGNNTSMCYLKKVRSILRSAVEREWLDKNVLNNYQCSYIEPEKDVLDEKELQTLYEKQMPVERLDEVKNAYLFMCYTGFAYKDASKLTPDHIVRFFDGEEWLVKNREKIKKTICKESVPLLPIAKEIIEKYKNHSYCKEKNLLLPISSNQKYNAYLKEVADICGIKKHLTTHTARHTFATTVTLANGVPIETVSAMLGHKSIKTTQIYAKIVAKKIGEDMSELKTKLAMKQPALLHNE
ncbi:site-specific integrase [Mucilaginibacter ginsenosidivorans]|uniref:Site-specific integrase n=1 Tax=Mucilaginibacter ginsenosidivorans TaxID=398053 RepID=A0A5B8UVV0_9SPHI|nr:site-specific integrase [Mucilaginibacter ginsenosidivorans]QEC62461.1 site-specific integrase [Mucilaginibacter ginsenosidivorans]